MTSTGKEGAVAAAVETLRKAMIAADKTALESVTLPELSYGHASGRLETRAEFIESLTSGKASFSAIELSKQTISVVDKTAIVRYVFVGTRRDKPGKPAELKLATLTVWQQQQDQWKLLARQSVKL